ncbi:MAG: hypothetical protein HYX47_02130 [Burkholderiales bacterium]|nr:hypothetical protein [Burkholderiales bacterium]
MSRASSPDTLINVDEALGKVTIITRSRSMIIIDDPNKSMVLQDMNGNKIEMTAEGIAITSAGDLTFHAKGKISADSAGNIELAARADLKGTGINISHAATAGYKASGNTSAELSGGMEATIKAAMVMIN